MHHCYLCAQPLVKNGPYRAGTASVEHVIMDAFGGRLKSYQLLCKTCNTQFGGDCDRALFRHLAPLLNLWNRKNGKPRHTSAFPLPVSSSSALQSVLKTAVNFYLHKKLPQPPIAHLFPVLRNEQALSNTVVHYHPEQLETPAAPTHTIILQGDAASQLLLAYVELFSTYGFLVLLSDHYTGADCYHSYAYDIKHLTTSYPTHTLKITREDWAQLTAADAQPALQERFHQVKGLFGVE
jgi:hypothetical protein